MKIKYLKLKNWLLVTLGGLPGLPVGCTLPMEYGSPEATYPTILTASKTVPTGTQWLMSRS